MGTKRQKMDNPTCSKECPVCFQIPRANVYQCVNGHSLCDICSEKVTLCPICRSSRKRSRNLYAEILLDDMQFKCGWSGRGCEKTMSRGQLSAHEDQCENNPDAIKFCSMFQPGKGCEYKFTSKWLRESDNCTYFINHVETCFDCPCNQNIRLGKTNFINLPFSGTLLSSGFILSRKVHQIFTPTFHRLTSVNQGEDEEQLFFLIPLLKVDTSGVKTLSFEYVQLTPETNPLSLQVKFTINGSPSSKMASQWGQGQNNLPSLNWTQKPICFKRLVEMVEASSKDSQQTEIPFPFSIPVSFLTDYYLNANMKLIVNFTLEQAS